MTVGTVWSHTFTVSGLYNIVLKVTASGSEPIHFNTIDSVQQVYAQVQDRARMGAMASSHACSVKELMPHTK